MVSSIITLYNGVQYWGGGGGGGSAVRDSMNIVGVVQYSGDIISFVI